MGVPTRLAGFALALLGAFGLAFGAGRVLADEPERSPVPAEDAPGVHGGHEGPEG